MENKNENSAGTPESAAMKISKNARNFYELYVANCVNQKMWIACSTDSEAYKAIEELRNAGIISIEIGQVIDLHENKVDDHYGITKIKDFMYQ